MQSPQPLNSPTMNCFCGCLASPCRDNKYCSKQCAREDAGKMLIGEPSHYRNISQTEILGKLTRSKSLCRVANGIVGEVTAARDVFKPLPPLPSSLQFHVQGALVDMENNTLDPKREDTLPLQRSLRRLRSFVLAKRTKQRIC